MWVGMDAVDWAALEHNYGSAKDVPGLLRRCAGPHRDDAEDAADELLNVLFHQGGWICPAAPAALPFLLRLASATGVPSRIAVLELLAMLAGEAARVPERFLDPAWPPAWRRALPEVLALLDDAEPGVRRAAADVVAVCDTPGELILPTLVRRWHEEDDLATRLDLVLALGKAVLREPAGPRAADVLGLLRELVDATETQIRLAAVHALAPSDSGLPDRRLDLLLAAVRDPSVEVWRRTSSVQTGVQGVQQWTAALFTGSSPSFALGLLARHPDEEQRIGALGQAGGLLGQWRSPTTLLLPAIAARLDDPNAEVRFRAAELMACLGPAAAAHADEVAALLDDKATRATRTQQSVAEAALWALARMNDPRCLPGLGALIGGARSGFASHSASYPVDWHHVVLPALHEALICLPDHADHLLPVICEQLHARADGSLLNRLCEVLAAWGDAAEAAVPHLLSLLEHDRTWIPAATALAGIGRAGNAARASLVARSAVGGKEAELAAWAYWKVGGDPGPALKVLGPAAAEGRFRHPA